MFLPTSEISTNNFIQYIFDVMLNYSVEFMANLWLSLFPVFIKMKNNYDISLNREQLALCMQTWHHML